MQTPFCFLRRTAVTNTTFLLAALTVFAASGCGEEEPAPDPNAIVCNVSQPTKTIGMVGDVEGDFTLASGFTAETMLGERTDRRLTFNLGEVEFIVPGMDPEMRPRILVLQTNVADPNGSDLLENLNRFLQDSDDNTLEVVDVADDEYCDVAEGKICARFGLDNIPDGQLNQDGVIHKGVGGTVTFDTWTATRVKLHWDIEFGPNISKQFDDSDGELEGCFESSVAPPQGGSEILRPAGS